MSSWSSGTQARPVSDRPASAVVPWGRTRRCGPPGGGCPTSTSGGLAVGGGVAGMAAIGLRLPAAMPRESSRSRRSLSTAARGSGSRARFGTSDGSAPLSAAMCQAGRAGAGSGRKSRGRSLGRNAVRCVRCGMSRPALSSTCSKGEPGGGGPGRMSSTTIPGRNGVAIAWQGQASPSRSTPLSGSTHSAASLSRGISENTVEIS